MPAMNSAQVAKAALAAMNKRKSLVIPGSANQLAVLLSRITPKGLLLFVLKRIMRPGS
jgi:short-subunit dehydrogenase